MKIHTFYQGKNYKKTNTWLIVLLIIFQCISVSYSQNKQDFAPINAEWYYGRIFASASHISYNRYHVVADTTINSKSCKIMKVLYPTCNGMHSSFYVYQDNSKIYYNSQANDSFLLLYDFGKEKGESWWIKINNNIFHSDSTIDSILVSVIDVRDTVIGDDTLSIMDVTMNNSYYWVGFDGKIYKYIGHEKDLFPFILGSCDESFNHILRCFISDEDSLSILFDSTISCDYSNVGIAHLKDSKSTHIFPNPATNQLNIDNQDIIKEVYIYNLLGKQIKHFNINDSKTTLNISDLSKGFYFLHIQTHQGVTVKRFVKE